VGQPVFKFRSDHAYLSPAELDAKARAKAELQEALERQVGGGEAGAHILRP
jgi:hypothetical protein